MPTVFESLGDGFYTAFFEPDPDKRRVAIEAWIQAVTPIIQSAVENDLRSYLEDILKDTWEVKGWKPRAEKYYGRKVRIGKKDEVPFIDAYKLYLDVKLRTHSPYDKDVIVSPLTPEIRAKTLEAAEREFPKPTPIRNPTSKIASSIGIVADGGSDDDSGNDSRSSNDDRSDSMNPNNDSYQSSMDNHSDQMNPNNDAYWSSRGR